VPVEIIGLISTHVESEIHHYPDDAVVDPDYVARFARAHEHSDFDRILIGYSSASPDGTQVAAFAATQTDRISFLVAHRPGFVSPTVAARTFATLDQFTGGRVALHTITGAADAELARDGDHLTKPQRYRRSGEYLQVLKKAWTADEPFDFAGQFYNVERFFSAIKPFQQPRIPVYFGGSSSEAYEVGAAEADVFAFFAQPHDQMTEEFDKVRAAAQAAGRSSPPGFSVSFRPILGATEDLAWKRAHQILERAESQIRSGAVGAEWRKFDEGPRSEGARRQLHAAGRGDRHDRALWTPLAAATGAAGNSTALVGTPETVAEALLDYVDLGASTLLIRGYDPLDDAIDYGRELIPRVREGVARRDKSRGAPVAVSALTSW
jgi:alkanesulfonate monooxygenase